MAANHELVKDVHLVILSGPLNASQAQQIVHVFRELSERGTKRVVVDLEDVLFIDGPGLAALIAGYEFFGSDSQNFRLTGIQEQPRLLFDLTGFDRVFAIFDSVSEASTEGETECTTITIPLFSHHWQRQVATAV